MDFDDEFLAEDAAEAKEPAEDGAGLAEVLTFEPAPAPASGTELADDSEAPAEPSRMAAAGAAARDTLAAGFAGMQAVSRARREHSEARSLLKQMNDEISDVLAELRRRQQIEQNYPSIVAEQTAELEDARAVLAAAEQRKDELQASIQSMDAEHKQLVAANEQERRPYKQLMESTKGRADDTAANLASIRRSVRSAETALSQATERRETRISAANRAVDGASARITQLSAEIAQLAGDPSTDPSALENLLQNKAMEEAHLREYKVEVASVTEETQAAVAHAQDQIFSAKQALTEAEREAEAAKEEARERKDAYDRLLEQHQAAEAELKKRIADAELAVRDTAKEAERAQERIDEAQDILNDANDVHATPEVTAAYKAQVDEAREAITAQEREVHARAAEEQEMRESTRSKRIIFVAVCAVAALVVLLIVLMVTGVIKLG